MAKLYTRGEFRDRIRRKLGIVPPIDIIGSMATAGDQPTNYPYPTNQQINDALLDGISDVNRECGFHVSEVSVPVNGVAAGEIPFALYLGDLTPNSTGTTTAFNPVGTILDVQRVLWLDGGTTPSILLQPMYRDDLDRGGNSTYYNTPPSTPRQYYIEGYVLYVTPAQANSGTYVLTVGTGVNGLQCDDDPLDQVPIDYQVVFEDRAIFRLALTQTMDVEAQERAAGYGALSAEGMKRFKEWKLGGTGAPIATINFGSYRGGYGTRRVVR